MDNLSLAHSKYNCTYHIVFIPKYRRKVMFGNLRKEVGEAISESSYVTGSCTYVCLNSSKRKCRQGSGKNQREIFAHTL